MVGPLLAPLANPPLVSLVFACVPAYIRSLCLDHLNGSSKKDSPQGSHGSPIGITRVLTPEHSACRIGNEVEEDRGGDKG